MYFQNFQLIFLIFPLKHHYMFIYFIIIIFYCILIVIFNVMCISFLFVSGNQIEFNSINFQNRLIFLLHKFKLFPIQQRCLIIFSNQKYFIPLPYYWLTYYRRWQSQNKLAKIKNNFLNFL